MPPRPQDHLVGGHEVADVEHGLRDPSHAHRELPFADYEAGRIILAMADDDEAADALIGPVLDRAGEDQMRAGHATAGDPVLATI